MVDERSGYVWPIEKDIDMPALSVLLTLTNVVATVTITRHSGPVG
jgi:hypothetical protein